MEEMRDIVNSLEIMLSNTLPIVEQAMAQHYILAARQNFDWEVNKRGRNPQGDGSLNPWPDTVPEYLR